MRLISLMEGGVDDGSLDRSIKAENVGIERKVMDFFFFFL